MSIPYSLERSVDRIEECKYLINLLSDIQKKEFPPIRRVLHVCGKSRRGKSWLLNLYKDILTPDHHHLLPQKYLDLIPKENKLYSLPVYLALDKLINLDGASITKEVENEFSRNMLRQIAVAVGMSSLDEKWSPNIWTEHLVAKMQGMDNNTITVFLFDEVSWLPNELVSKLEDHVLAPLLYINNVVFVITGRQKITGWKEFPLRPEQGSDNVIELPSFNLETTREQIENRRPEASPLHAQVFGLSGGSPGNNDDILNVAKGLPLAIDELEAIKICNDDVWIAVRNKFKDKEELGVHALEALCVLHDFDKEYEVPILFSSHPELAGDWDTRSANLLLVDLMDINIGPGRLMDWDRVKSAYAIEEQIRVNLEKELKIRGKDLWKTLHCAAMKMYSGWAKDYYSDIFAAKSDYHKTRLAEAGFDPGNC